MSKLAITLKKSLNRQTERQVATVQALGLHKIGQTVIHQDNPAVRGMVQRVRHLVTCVETEEGAAE